MLRFRPFLSHPGVELLESRIAPATLLAVTENNSLLRFDHLTPSVIDAETPVTGLGVGETLRGIDFDPFTGVMAGLSVDGNGAGRFYTIDPSTGAATLVSTLRANPTDTSNPFTVITGNRVSWDFSMDKPGDLRILGDNGQNLQVDFASGLVKTDVPLFSRPSHLGDPASKFSGVSEYRSATSVSFLTVDVIKDAVMVYSSSMGGNLGTLTWVRDALVDDSSEVGMDTDTQLDNRFRSVAAHGITRLAKIGDRETPITLGTIGNGTRPIRDIALVLNVWTGAGGDDLWTTAANWKANLVPATDSELLFPAGAARPTNVNDFPAGTPFQTIRWAGDGYAVSGNELAVTRSLHASGGTVTLDTDVTIDSGGIGMEPAVFFINNLSRIKLNGTLDLNANKVDSLHLGTLEINGDVVGEGWISTGSNTVIVNGRAGADVTFATGISGSLEINHGESMASVSLGVNGAVEGTLSGSGSIRELTVFSGSTVFPGGTEIGTLTVGGNMFLHYGSTLHVDLYGSGEERKGDQLVTKGFLLIEGNLQLSGQSDNRPNGQFTIIDNQGSWPVTGIFTDLPEGAIASGGGYHYQITYQGGDGNDVVLTQIFEPAVSKNGRSLQFTDVDGDLVTVSVNKGTLEPWRVRLRPVGDGSRFEFEQLDLSTLSEAEFDQANVTIKAVPQDLDGDGKKEGDGFVNLGQLQATDVNLGTVRVDGNLGGIVAGDISSTAMNIKAGVKSLHVRAFGNLDLFTSDLRRFSESRIEGRVEKLQIENDLAGALLKVTGKAETISIGGSILGGSDLGRLVVDLGIHKVLTVGGTVAGEIRSDSGVIQKVNIRGDLAGTAEQRAGIFGYRIESLAVKGSVVFGDLNSRILIAKLSIGGDLQDSSVAAGGNAFANLPNRPAALGKVTIGGNMERSLILGGVVLHPEQGFGYDPDAWIGPVLIRGDFKASNIAVGINPGEGAYGDDDDHVLLTGGDPTIAARIAKLTVLGQVFGTEIAGDSFGIVAEQIDSVQIGTNKLKMTSAPGEGASQFFENWNGEDEE